MTGIKMLIPALVAGAIVLAPAGWAGPDPAAGPEPAAAQFGRVPPHFIRNNGQLPDEVAFYLKGPRGTVYLTADGVVFDFFSGRAEPPDRPDHPGEDPPDESGEASPFSRLVFRFRFPGAGPGTVIEGEKELPGKINYFIGDRSSWRTSIPIYEEVVYRGLYPGIDLSCRLEGANIRYRYTVAPGADPGRIVLAYSGVEGLEPDPAGDLIVLTGFGGFRTPAPRLHQEIKGERLEREGAFVIREDSSVALEIGPYDRGLPLVIEM